MTTGTINASTNRLAWTSTIEQGMGNGLEAFKHKVSRLSNGSTVIVKNFDWTADANAVKVELKGK